MGARQRGATRRSSRAPSGQVQIRGPTNSWAQYRGFIGFFFKYWGLSDFLLNTGVYLRPSLILDNHLSSFSIIVYLALAHSFTIALIRMVGMGRD